MHVIVIYASIYSREVIYLLHIGGYMLAIYKTYICDFNRWVEESRNLNDRMSKRERNVQQNATDRKRGNC